MSESQLIYMPLGGAGEIGMNAYLYGIGPEERERFILVDLGVTFPDMDTTPGVDLILPDLSWLEARVDRLEAIFLTHGHEDHIGAVARLYGRLNVPIYARPFTAHLVRLKLEDAGLDTGIVRPVSPWPEAVKVGPFTVGFAPMSHSIPESAGLVIDTPHGRVVHTGDFKLDQSPGVGEPFDESAWAEIAAPGVQALICDSTNVFSLHPGRSEAEIGPKIRDLILSAKGMVAATTFASNLARLRTLALAGQEAGRSVCILGRAMRRMITAGLDTGILAEFPPLVSPEDATEIPRQNLLL
ncbi:MAG: ribonuclease J, partial [Pseudomonadota bacterium]